MFCVKNQKKSKDHQQNLKQNQTYPKKINKNQKEKRLSLQQKQQLSLQPWCSRRTAPAPWDASVWDVTSLEVFKVGGAWSTLGQQEGVPAHVGAGIR